MSTSPRQRYGLPNQSPLAQYILSKRSSDINPLSTPFTSLTFRPNKRISPEMRGTRHRINQWYLDLASRVSVTFESKHEDIRLPHQLLSAP